MNNIYIKTPSRLHLGFYNFYEENTMYGGIGLALDTPCVELIVSKSNELEVINKTSIDIDDVINNIVNKLGIDKFKVVVESAIPRHIGLGSTTQLALAIGYSVSKLYGLNYSIRELAVKLGRGYVSGIGIGVFEKGGLLIDSGRRLDGNKLEEVRTIYELPLVITRYPLPRNWYFVLITPRTNRRISDEEEKLYLEKPLEIDKNTQYELYKILLLELIPSIIHKDIVMFGKTISKIQIVTGRFFSKYQHGVFCCRESEELVNILINKNVYGIGQSSWGPTIYGIVDSYSKALRVINETVAELEKRGIAIDYKYVSRPRNKGALIKYL